MFWRLLILIVLLIGLSAPSHATARIKYLAPSDKPIAMEEHMAIYLSDNPKLTIREIRAIPPSEWETSGKVPNLGFTDKTLWIKMSIFYDSRDEREWVLSIENPHLAAMEMYAVKMGYVAERWEFGRGKRFSQRPMVNRNFTVPLHFRAMQRTDLYIKVNADSSMLVPITLTMHEPFMLKNEQTILLLGLIFGGLGMMVLYGVLFHLALREPMHLYYAWFVGSLTFLHIALYGIGYQFLWPGSGEFQQYSLMFGVVAATTSGAQFAAQVLDFKRPDFKPYRLAFLAANWMMVLGILLLPFFSKLILVRWMLVWVIVIAVVGICSAMHAMIIRAKLAFPYFSGFIAFHIGAALLVFSRSGLLPYHPVSEHGLLGATLFGSVVMLLVVRQRFREQHERKLLMQNKELTTEKKARQLQSRYSDMLEQRVKERTEELEDALTDLAKANEETELAIIHKTKFLAAASHDIRQPMNALYFYLNSLEQVENIEPRVLHGVQECVDNLNELFHALFDISKFDTHSWPVSPQHVDLSKVFDQLALEFQNQLHVMMYFEPRHPAVIADPVLLQRSLRILVANAIHHAEAKQLLIHTRRRGNIVRLEVRDNGIGIPPNKQEDIFNEFVQLSRDVYHRNRGLGLGLSLFRRMCQAMGAQFGVRSQVGRGSVFWFEVPIGDLAKVKKEERVESLDDRSLEKLKVLYVEDDHRVRQAVIPMLQSWGCEVNMAADASGVIRMVENKQNEPDLILSDYGLPGNINGLQVIAMVRKYFGRQIPALLVSGDMQLTEAKTYGIPLLAKPLRPARLREALIQLHAQKDAEANQK